MNMSHRAALAAALLIAAVTLAWAGAARSETVPIEVTSDSMSYTSSGGEVVFEGNVHVVRAGVEIWAAKMTIHFSAVAGQGDAVEQAMDPGDIEKIVATGGVRLSSGGRTGACGTATYFVDQGLLQMDGNPVLTDGPNTIEGKTIRYWVHSNRSEVVGDGDQRVRATFSSPGDAGVDLP